MQKTSPGTASQFARDLPWVDFGLARDALGPMVLIVSVEVTVTFPGDCTEPGFNAHVGCCEDAGETEQLSDTARLNPAIDITEMVADTDWPERIGLIGEAATKKSGP